MAAAIGVDLPIHEPAGSVIVDVGGGTTEVAVISLGGIVVAKSTRIGGDEFDEDIVNWVKKEYNLLLGDRTAEQLKMAVGSAWPFTDEPNAEIRGRDLVSGLPKTVIISAAEVREAIEESVQGVVDAIKFCLDKTPPELAADVMDRGIVITGGGALLRGLDVRIANETGTPVITADRPLHSVVVGSGRCLEDFDMLQELLTTTAGRL
jgi:rod shape-determining protein MreB